MKNLFNFNFRTRSLAQDCENYLYYRVFVKWKCCAPILHQVLLLKTYANSSCIFLACINNTKSECRLTKLLSSIQVKVGSNITLLCGGVGYCSRDFNRISYTWYKEDIIIAKGRQVSYFYNTLSKFVTNFDYVINH